MSRGYDFDDREPGRKEEGEAQIPNEERLQAGRCGAAPNSSHPGRRRRGSVRATEQPTDARTLAREEERIPDRRYELTARERSTLRDVGRFRTISDALLKHQYNGMAAAMRRELGRLQHQGFLQRRSISVGKHRDTLVIVALTEEGAEAVRQDGELRDGQSVYAGFVKPAEVPHDAAIYQMYQAEAAKIEANGGNVRRVVLDYELKKEVYSRLARQRDAGVLEYAQKQQQVAADLRLPIVDGKISLPDLRIEYETPEADLDHVDLELATEHYHRGHMNTKARTGFKMYGFVSTSRGGRAKWEGRELTATVLSL
jgi:hypothetical protein